MLFISLYVKQNEIQYIPVSDNNGGFHVSFTFLVKSKSVADVSGNVAAVFLPL